MEDSTLSALYLLYLAVAFLWNATAAAAFRRDASVSRARRMLAVFAFASSLAGLTWPASTTAFGMAGWTYALAAALPLSFLAAAASTALAARAGQRWAWIACAYDSLLFFVLASRWLAYLGAPVGLAGESLSLSYVGLQWIAFSPAILFPGYVHVPILSRPAAPQSGVVLVAWRVWLTFASLTVALVLWGWPASGSAVGSWRHVDPMRMEFRRAPGAPALVRSSRILETLRVPRAGRYFDADLARLRDLRLEAATVVLSADALEGQEELLRSLDRFVAQNRTEGRKLVMWVQGRSAWYSGVWPSRAELARVLGEVQRDVARRYRPDVQAVLGDPLLADALLARGGLAPDSARWTLAALAESVRAGNPGTLVAAYGLDGPGPAPDTLAGARETLLRWAAGDSSPIDRVGFALEPGFGGTDSFSSRLGHADTLLRSLGAGKRAWVFEFALCPVVFGEHAQANHLRWVAAWAARDPRFEGISQLGLADYAETVGLVTSLGRKREAYVAYRELSRSPSPSP